jgi:signal transduction histidine kinase
MVNELLDVARLQMGRPLELEMRRTDLVALARQVARELQATSDRHQIRVVSDHPSIFGEWDMDRLERILVNLLANAVKYSERGGDIIVTLRFEPQTGGDWVELSVADQGIGIPEAERDRVFERFVRGSNVTDGIVGAGVGLSSVRQLVESHGGSVSVTSELGVGSTFTIRLPTSPPRLLA